MITVRIECTKDVLAQTLDILRRPKFFVELAELFLGQRRRAWITVLIEAFLPSPDIVACQRRVFANRFENVLVHLTLR